MGQQGSFKRTNLTLEETTEFVHYWSICGHWFGRALDTRSSQRVQQGVVVGRGVEPVGGILLVTYF